ncbi:molybdopterin oxidoreductase [Spirochaetia bacterium]|nr:molybdopterin oxidoreductase [Spirochaetia bacterium]
MADEVRELVCVVCPNGCRLRADISGGEIAVSGNKCKRGIAFARAEITNPTRTLTTTVRTSFPGIPVLPVRTDGEIPKGKIRELMGFLNTITVKSPLGIGSIVAEDALGLGIDIIATSNVLKERA